MRYYIADLHFNHENLNTRMDCRGFESGEAMNEYMIAQWNSRVRKRDEVVILGDFCISKKGEIANAILERLNGRKYLILGNHDYFAANKQFDSSHFEWITHYREINDNNRKVILCHYPVMCYNGQYRRNAQGEPKTYMLYGHVHNTYDEYLLNEFQNQTDFQKNHQKILHCYAAFYKTIHLPPRFLNMLYPTNHSFSSSCCTLNSGLSDIKPRRSASDAM